MSEVEKHQPIPGDSTPYAGLRVGDAERQAAIAALGQQWRAGRLDPAEHERRTTAAFAATTRGELDALFADLPGDPGGAPAGVPAVPGAAVRPTAPVAGPVGVATGEGVTSWLARNRGAVHTMVPLLAVVLFVVFHHWVVFLLIPIAYTLLGTLGGNGYGRDRQRDRRRGC